MITKKNNYIRLGIAGIAFLVLIDQLTKWAAYRFLRVGGPVKLLPGIFELHYLENRGAAFGMLKNMQWIFILFALVITGFMIYCYIKVPIEKRFFPLRIVCIVLSAGALGNMVDRILHRYVIDFLYVSLIDFPIFNVADIYVCISTAAFLILLLFYYKEEDFDRLKRQKSRQAYLDELKEKIRENIKK